jgi:hypothetical protein
MFHPSSYFNGVVGSVLEGGICHWRLTFPCWPKEVIEHMERDGLDEVWEK